MLRSGLLSVIARNDHLLLCRISFGSGLQSLPGCGQLTKRFFELVCELTGKLF